MTCPRGFAETLSLLNIREAAVAGARHPLAEQRMGSGLCCECLIHCGLNCFSSRNWLLAGRIQVSLSSSERSLMQPKPGSECGDKVG